MGHWSETTPWPDGAMTTRSSRGRINRTATRAIANTSKRLAKAAVEPAIAAGDCAPTGAAIANAAAGIATPSAEPT